MGFGLFCKIKIKTKTNRQQKIIWRNCRSVEHPSFTVLQKNPGPIYSRKCLKRWHLGSCSRNPHFYALHPESSSEEINTRTARKRRVFGTTRCNGDKQCVKGNLPKNYLQKQQHRTLTSDVRWFIEGKSTIQKRR